MYKYYDKNSKKVLYQYFDSIFEFLDFIDNAPVATSFAGLDLESENKDNGNWAGTATLNQAEEYAKYGYYENFDKFLDLKLKLEKYIKLTSKKNKQYNYYVGYAPDVKAYLEGSPLSMLDRKKESKKQIDIYFNISYSAATSKEQIFNRGVITLSLVEVLETLGFSVNLNLFEISYKEDQVTYFVWNLKNVAERANIKKLYFPMCHQAFLRRLAFKLLEVTKDIKQSWHFGYGRPGSENLIREIIDLKENDIVIAQPSEMGVFGNDIIEDANNMYDIINRKRKTEDFELPKLKLKKY